MADDYMRQVAQAYYGVPNAPVMDAPPVQGDPAAMAAPDWNDPTKYGGGGMSAAPPPEPLVSVAPPPPPPAQSAPPPPAAPAPIRPNWSDPTTYGGAVAAPQGPLHLNVPAPTPAQEAAIKAVENIKPSAPAPKPEADVAPIADAPAAGAPGGGGPRVPGGSDVSVALSAPGFDYRMIPGAGGPVRNVEKDMLGPKAHGLIDHGFGAESEGTATAAQLQQAQAAREAEAMQLRANQLQEQQDAMERARAQRADELAKLHAEMKADADQVAAQNIDNDEIYGKGGINKGMAMVGIALGGFLQGMRGGPNVALDAINTQIERSVAAQKFAHEAKLKSFDAKQSAYKMALEKYGQEDVAQNMARIYMLDKYAAETAKMAATSKSSDAQAVNAKLQGEFAKSKDMLNATNLKLIQVGGGGGRRFVDPRTGLTYSEAELKKRYDAQELETVKTGLEMTKDTNKAKAEGKADQAAGTIAEKVAPLDSAISVFDRAIKKLEPQTDPKTGQVTPALAPITTGERVVRANLIPGSRWAYDNLKSQTEKQRQQDVDAAMNALLQMKSGAGITESDLARFNAQLRGSGSNEELLHGLKAVRDEVAEKKKAFAAGNVAGSKQYESNRQTLTPTIKLEPRK